MRADFELGKPVARKMPWKLVSLVCFVAMLRRYAAQSDTGLRVRPPHTGGRRGIVTSAAENMNDTGCFYGYNAS